MQLFHGLTKVDHIQNEEFPPKMPAVVVAIAGLGAAPPNSGATVQKESPKKAVANAGTGQNIGEEKVKVAVAKGQKNTKLRKRRGLSKSPSTRSGTKRPKRKCKGSGDGKKRGEPLGKDGNPS